ncbi:DUF3631 domain-containing protein [Paraburkholderia sp. USG1]|uniref:DUF3631 domain-containing protein n=1 Tax=Paraburkholderia sp. USG1 TaxID=2952268 RepID=UPI0028654CC8|nr:DUF3631 domain-containing protein [Paraburkholderia sp. USG1]MDR8399757.1 DUF3631 domain-containing protein [Paraburkholderia sp. USG1]
MSAIDFLPTTPIGWARHQSEIALMVAEIYEQLERCKTVHPVATMLGMSEPVGFENAGPVTISGIDFSNALAFPIRKCDGEVMNILLVSDLGDGTVEEAYIPGVPIGGGYVSLGEMNGDTIHVAIDLPSALTIAHATGSAVACAIYTDNLADVAAALRAKYPNKEIIVCAGTSGGMSRPVAARAASRIGARMAVAETGGTFAGCYREAGAKGIIQSLEAAEIQISLDQTTEALNPLDPPEPTRWPGHVNGNLMAQHAVMLIRRYLIVDIFAAITIVLWALATYFVKDIRIAPLLAFISPTRRCGKTRTLGLLKSLVYRPFATSGTTAAAIYRLPKRKPTMLIDEIDTFLHSKELVGVVNCGHTRDAASIVRVEKGKTVSFDTFFMKALFGIGFLPETLADRSIVIPLERKAEDDEVETHIVSENDMFAPVRACFAQLAHLYADAVRHASRNPIKLSNDRAGDNWEPLLAAASILGENWVAYARHAAKILSVHTGSQSDAGLEELLRDIKLAFDSLGASRLSTKHLIQLLTADEEKPWATYSNGRPITANALAKMLKPFGISSTSLRETRAASQENSSPSLKGYYRDDFAKAFRQYVPREPGEPDETDESA